jgi:ABC-2 type transport system permease protein
MNANFPMTADTRAPVSAPHATHKFKLLLRREFWEHKGGFFWAPIVAGGVSLLLTTMAVITGEVMLRRAAANGSGLGDSINVNGAHFQVNGLDLGMITSKMTPADIGQLGGAIDASLLVSSVWPFIALAFVVFFYCIGALYDDRKDRSVLFWKSLPVSDRDTVLSKVASATLVAPVIASLAALLSMFGFLLIMSVVVLAHGGNPFTLLWGPASPLGIAAKFIAAIPVYALWSLPTVGWLLLCSAWARSKPFLWALMVPVFSGIFVSWFDLMHVFNLESSWFWKNIVARMLLSTVPGSWFNVAHFGAINTDGPQAVSQAVTLQSIYSVLATPDLWIGVVAGVAMIVVAIRLRRWRDEG